MSVSNLVIKITDALKPVLVKIIPQEYLSRAKKAYMNRNTTKLKDAKIAPYKPGRYAEGINLIGSIQAASGLGQSLLDAVQHQRTSYFRTVKHDRA